MTLGLDLLDRRLDELALRCLNHLPKSSIGNSDKWWYWWNHYKKVEAFRERIRQGKM